MEEILTAAGIYDADQRGDAYDGPRPANPMIDTIVTNERFKEQQAAAEAKFRPELLPPGLKKSELRRQTLEAFFRMTGQEQDKVIADLQDTLANGAAIPKGEPPPPEVYHEVLENLHSLQMYAIERALDRAVRRIIPEVILPIVRHVIREALQ
ncbi:MAG: hypothetical protein ACYC3I_27575 [Gemmataceae bacterium]